MTPLLLALFLAVQGPLEVAVVEPTEGPRLLVHRQAGPLVALRLSAPVDPALPEGSVELLQELAGPGARAAAERYGARLALRHEEGAALLTVTGPATAFDALAALLRRAATEPDLSVASLRRARARAEDRVLARLERPGPRVHRLLWHALHGGPEPAGAAASLLPPEAVRQLSARLYDPARIRITVVGAVPDEVLRSAFGHWTGGVDPDPDAVLTPADPPVPARPQAHREWAGLGYRVDGAAPVLAVAATLIQRRLDRSALRYGVVRPWQGPGGSSLVLVGATEPGDSVVRSTAGVGTLRVRGAGPAITATGVGSYLRRMIAEAAALAGPAGVAEARSDLRRSLLLEARTVSGRAEVIGRAADALGSPDAAARFLDGLETVSLPDVQAALHAVLETPATYVEAR